MKKTLLHRLFGWGSLPKAMRPLLENEDIALLDEGIGGSVTFRNYRAPGKRYGYRRNWFTGSIVITGLRFAAFAFSKPIINVPLDGPGRSSLEISVEGESTLFVGFAAGAFQENSSGSVTVRLRTPKARLFLERLER